jgi:S1-C subfamily serine protease
MKNMSYGLVRTGFLLSFFATCMMAAEDLPRPEIPDPFGLGERLALIDHLRETMGVTPPQDATLEQLIALYWKHKKPAQTIINHDEALAQDRMRRMRQELQDKFSIIAEANADEAKLNQLLSEARAAKNEADVKAVLDKAAARENPSSPEEAARYAQQDREAAQARRNSLETDMRSLQRELERVESKRAELDKQGEAAVQKAETLKREYNAALSSYNVAVNSYNKKADEGSPDAVTILEQVKQLRSELNAKKSAHDQQLLVIKGLVDTELTLREERAKIQERIQRGQEQVADAQRAVVEQGGTPSVGSTTPGGKADGPAAGSLQEKIIHGVVLLVVPGRGSGSGFIVSRDGYIVTNAHVVGSATASVTAYFDASAARKPVRLKVVEYAQADDLALLKADSGAFEPLMMQEVYELSRPILAAGFPLAGTIANTLQTSPTDIVLSRGILGAVRRQGERVEWLQHDCRIASGNSGGPIIDQQNGSVIGVNTLVLEAKDSKGHGDGLNLAIPVRKVIDRFAAQLKR